MTKTHKINRTCCQGKLAYLTEAQATDAAVTLSAKQQAILVGYDCDVCGYWHIGHPGKRRTKQ